MDTRAYSCIRAPTVSIHRYMFVVLSFLSPPQRSAPSKKYFQPPNVNTRVKIPLLLPLHLGPDLTDATLGEDGAHCRGQQGRHVGPRQQESAGAGEAFVPRRKSRDEGALQLGLMRHRGLPWIRLCSSSLADYIPGGFVGRCGVGTQSKELDLLRAGARAHVAPLCLVVMIIVIIRPGCSLRSLPLTSLLSARRLET